MFHKIGINYKLLKGIIKMTPLEQLRANRQHALNAWINGSDMKDMNDTRFPRFVGDDGRSYRIEEYSFWPQAWKDAEQVEFDRLDAIYEAEKAALG
tara:strand:- start:20720 stop:21007 length:288 start_codon:yes stop_codon:yes gene_type:complete